MVLTPEQALAELLESVDNICDWLDYEFKVVDIEAALRGLNHCRIKYLIALSKARGDVDRID